VAKFLPFRYMVGFPVEILTGQVDAPNLLLGFGVQIFWTLVSVGLAQLVWTNGLRRYSAVGG
jgi:ABC-2 type transport system permease protein